MRDVHKLRLSVDADTIDNDSSEEEVEYKHEVVKENPPNAKTVNIRSMTLSFEYLLLMSA